MVQSWNKTKIPNLTTKINRHRCWLRLLGAHRLYKEIHGYVKVGPLRPNSKKSSKTQKNLSTLRFWLGLTKGDLNFHFGRQMNQGEIHWKSPTFLRFTWPHSSGLSANRSDTASRSTVSPFNLGWTKNFSQWRTRLLYTCTSVSVSH